jgi:hypothetical protein
MTRRPLAAYAIAAGVLLLLTFVAFAAGRFPLSLGELCSPPTAVDRSSTSTMPTVPGWLRNYSRA